jgi:ketosteroid isomerase-like protein
MSQKNVEVVLRIYREVSAGVWEAPPELFDPEYEVDLTDAGPDLGVIPGVEATEAALRGYSETFEDFRIELMGVIHADEQRVVTAIRDGGRLKGSDAEVGTASSTSGSSVTGGSSVARPTPTKPRPSKPPGCGSNRCRRRTLRSCASPSRR